MRGEERRATEERQEVKETSIAAIRHAPRISVIVPVRNEGRFIRGTLEQLLNQDYEAGRFEILVVEGASTDATAAIVRELQPRFPHLHLHPNPQRLSSAARNIGIRNARGELILIVDGHCDINRKDLLRQVAQAFHKSGADCLGRPQPLNIGGASTLQRAIAAARSCWLGHHPASYIYSSRETFVPPQSVAVAYRRTVFEKVGFFDESFDACEDVEFNHRVDKAGLRCFISPSIAVRYHPRASLVGLFRQMVRYGRGRVRLLRKHPETLSGPSLLPGALVLGLAGGLGLCFVLPTLLIPYTVLAGFYALVVAVVSLSLAWHGRSLTLFCWLPLVFLTIHLGCGSGVLWEGARIKDARGHCR
jgi:succinoglycan biosynthesis protein ExoA